MCVCGASRTKAARCSWRRLKCLPSCRIITAPEGRKDLSECHIWGDDVEAELGALRAKAITYSDIQAGALSQEAQECHQDAADLLESSDILATFAHACAALGLVGEARTAQLLYLALTSRLLSKPVPVVVKGPSSGGKSFCTETVLRFFPESAFLDFTAMSERALIYDERPIDHRFIVLYEASGLGSQLQTYLIRSLLSEGCIKYATVEKTSEGLVPRIIERQEPTGLVLTTTWTSLHAENETRMLSVTVRDDVEQTKAVFAALADRADGSALGDLDLTPWHALQRWLELAGKREVVVPFAGMLAQRVSARAVRLRRDFGKLLSLIQTHAVLHQKSRDRDTKGRIVARVADYAAVYGLVLDIVSEGVEATVSKTVRATVVALEELSGEAQAPVSIARLAKALKLDKSVVSRRVRVAREAGYIVNLEEKKGKPARLVVGDPLPGDELILPEPSSLEGGGGEVYPPENQCNSATVDSGEPRGGGGVYPPQNECNTATVAPDEAENWEQYYLGQADADEEV